MTIWIDNDTKLRVNIHAAYFCNRNFDNEMNMASSIHCGLVTRKFCKVFEELYADIYINKSKLHLIQDKIEYHKRNIGGICDMTFYYLIQHLNLLKVQNLAKPHKIFLSSDKEEEYKCVFINHVSVLEGEESLNQYKSNCNISSTDSGGGGIAFDVQKINSNGPFIFDIINNEKYILFNLHFQGGTKRLLVKNSSFFGSLV